MITRRETARVLFGAATVAALGAAGAGGALAADKTVNVGIDLSLTGADAESAKRVENGALMAFDEANAKGGVNGYKIDVDYAVRRRHRHGRPVRSGPGRHQCAQDGVRQGDVAAIGPQMSGAGKAMAPILSQGNLATITPARPTPTSPTRNSPRNTGRRARRSTSAPSRRTPIQGPYMANYYADTLKVKTVYILDDSGAYGVGLADAFQAQAEKKGIKILGRDRLDPKAADYTAILTKIKSLNPDALYYGGVLQAGVKLAKQAYDIMPEDDQGRRRRRAGPGHADRASAIPPTRAGMPPSPRRMSPRTTKMAHLGEGYKAKFNVDPDDYAVTAYDAAHGDHRRGQADDRRRQGADARRRARRDPGGEGADAAGPGRRSTRTATWQDKTISVFQIKQDKDIGPPTTSTCAQATTTSGVGAARPDRRPTA